MKIDEKQKQKKKKRKEKETTRKKLGPPHFFMKPWEEGVGVVE